jgi:hypothetical protein
MFPQPGAAAKKDAAKPGGKAGGGRGGPAAPEEPPNFADMAVCNASGCLQHLTFRDDAKQQVGCGGKGCAAR